MEPFTNLLLFRVHKDNRGKLTAFDGAESFTCVRTMWMWDVPVYETRGNHAHKTTQQIIVAVHGKCHVCVTTKGGEKFEIELDSPDVGLWIESMEWVRLSEFRNEAVVLVFADRELDKDGIISDFEDFKNA